MPGYKEIIGNEQIIAHLKNTVKQNKVSQAYILSGDKGMGKKMIASTFAMALQCEKGEEEPCMECKSCKQAMSMNHPDIKWVTHEKPNVISVDEVRQQLVDDVQVKPYCSKYKVYIVDESEKMNVQAQNAILKTIEEPPEYAVVILLSNNIDTFLPTIVSRCVRLDMRMLRRGHIRNYLMKNKGVPDYQAEVIAAFAGGNLGKAIKLAGSEHFNELKEEVLRLLKYIGDMQVYEAVMAVKECEKYKVEIEDFIDLMMVWYRDILVFKVSQDIEEMTFKEQFKFIKDQAAKISFNGVEEVLKAMDKAKVRIRANVNYDLALEMMFLTIRDALNGKVGI